MMVAIGLANGANALQSRLVADVAAERIARIRGIDDDAAAAQYLDRLTNEAALGRYRMQLQIDTHVARTGPRYDTRMNQLLEWSPLIVFFVVFKLFGIYWATGALMLVCTLVLLAHRLPHRQLQDHARRHGAVVIWRWARRPCCCTISASFNGSPRCCSRSPPPPFSAARSSANSRLRGACSKASSASRWTSRRIPGCSSIPCGWAGSRCSPRRISMSRETFAESVWVNFKVFGISAAMLLFMIPQVIWLQRQDQAGRRRSGAPP